MSGEELQKSQGEPWGRGWAVEKQRKREDCSPKTEGIGGQRERCRNREETELGETVRGAGTERGGRETGQKWVGEKCRGRRDTEV